MENKMNKNLGYRDAYMNKDAGFAGEILGAANKARKGIRKHVTDPLRTAANKKGPYRSLNDLIEGTPQMLNKGRAEIQEAVGKLPPGRTIPNTPPKGVDVGFQQGKMPPKADYVGARPGKAPADIFSTPKPKGLVPTPATPPATALSTPKAPMSTKKKVALGTGATALTGGSLYAGGSAMIDSAKEEAMAQIPEGGQELLAEFQNMPPEEQQGAISELRSYMKLRKEEPEVAEALTLYISGNTPEEKKANQIAAFKMLAKAKPDLVSGMGMEGIQNYLGEIWKKYGTAIKWGGGALGIIMLLSMLGRGGGAGQRQQQPYGIGHAWR